MNKPGSLSHGRSSDRRLRSVLFSLEQGSLTGSLAPLLLPGQGEEAW